MKKFLSIGFILILSVSGFSQESRHGEESRSFDESSRLEIRELNDLDLVADATSAMFHNANIPEVFYSRLELQEGSSENPNSTGKIESIDSEEPLDKSDDDIWTEIGIYGFMTDISGEARRGDVRIDADVSFSDILENLDIGGMAYAEHRRGNWSFIIDLAYLAVSADDTVAVNQLLSLKLDAELEQLVAEGFVGYRVFERDYENTRLGIDVLGGVRYNYVKVDLDAEASLLGLTISSSRDTSEDWADGVIGGRVQYGQNRGWAVSGWADIGEGSDSSSYQLMGFLSYKFECDIRVFAGYRHFNINYDKGSGASRRGIDFDYTGPVLGVSYTF